MNSPADRFRRFFPVLAVCAAVALPSACKKKDEAAAPAAAPAAAEPTAPEPPKEEPPADLKPKWPAGKRLVVRNETLAETEMVNPVNQQPIKKEEFNTQDVGYTVSKEREGGGAEVELEVLSVRTESRTAGKVTVSFDPKSDPKTERNNPTAGMLRKLIGAKLKLQTAADGKIEKVDGLPQLVSKITAGSLQSVQTVARLMVNEAAVKNWDTLHQGLPEKPVKVGDTWETKREILFGITRLVITSTNTFKGWEERDKKKLARLEFAGTVAGKEGAPAGASTVADGATISGKALFDPGLGVVVDSESTMQFTLNITSATGQTMTAKSKTKITGKLADVADTGSPATADAKPAPAPETKQAPAASTTEKK